MREKGERDRQTVTRNSAMKRRSSRWQREYSRKNGTAAFAKTLGPGMKQEGTVRGWKLWNLSQSHSQNLLNDWCVVLAMAMGNGYAKEINDMARIWISTAKLEGFIDPSERHSETRGVKDFQSSDFKARSVHVHATGDVTGRARWNADQIIYHSSQPHHKFGNLRSRVGVGEDLCKNSANKSRIH